MVMPGKIRLIGAAPGSGKSEVSPYLENELQKRSSERWLVLEHEDVTPPQMRVNVAELAGIELSSKEFVFGYNLPGQLAFQALLRKIASQGINVIGLAPFENVYCEVPSSERKGEKLPLYEKMVNEDFADFDFELLYFVVTGRNEGEVEVEIQRRLKCRADKSEWQAKLDEDKVSNPSYYEDRATHIRKSAETFGLKVVEYPITSAPLDLADGLAEAICYEEATA